MAVKGEKRVRAGPVPAQCCFYRTGDALASICHALSPDSLLKNCVLWFPQEMQGSGHKNFICCRLCLYYSACALKYS